MLQTAAMIPISGDRTQTFKRMSGKFIVLHLIFSFEPTSPQSYLSCVQGCARKGSREEGRERDDWETTCQKQVNFEWNGSSNWQEMLYIIWHNVYFNNYLKSHSKCHRNFKQMYFPIWVEVRSKRDPTLEFHIFVVSLFKCCSALYNRYIWDPCVMQEPRFLCSKHMESVE